MKDARIRLAAVLIATLLGSAGAAGAAPVQGTMQFKNIIKDVKHVYFIRGPLQADGSTAIDRLIFTTADIGAKLKKCATMSCTEGKLMDGLIVDSGAGKQLSYSLVLKDGLVQFSGTEPAGALTLTTKESRRLVGRLKFDGTPQGGPNVDIQFDAPLLTDFKTGR